MRFSLFTAAVTALLMVDRALGHDVSQNVGESCAAAMAAMQSSSKTTEETEDAMASRALRAEDQRPSAVEMLVCNCCAMSCIPCRYIQPRQPAGFTHRYTRRASFSSLGSQVLVMLHYFHADYFSDEWMELQPNQQWQVGGKEWWCMCNVHVQCTLITSICQLNMHAYLCQLLQSLCLYGSVNIQCVNGEWPYTIDYSCNFHGSWLDMSLRIWAKTIPLACIRGISILLYSAWKNRRQVDWGNAHAAGRLQVISIQQGYFNFSFLHQIVSRFFADHLASNHANITPPTA